MPYRRCRKCKLYRRSNVNDKLDKSMSVQIGLCKTYDWQSDTVSHSEEVWLNFILLCKSSPLFLRKRLSVDATWERVGIELASACGD